MKKSLVLFLIFFSCVISCKKSNEIERKALINFYSGDVTIRETLFKRQVKEGDVLTQGMTVETGKDSYVEIYVGEKNIIKVMENSSLKISKLYYSLDKKANTIMLNVPHGEVFTRIADKLLVNDEFIVKSQNIVASVRGTDFLVNQGDKKGSVMCLDGEVKVHDPDNKEKAATVSGGEELDVEAGKDLVINALSEDHKKYIMDIIASIRKIQLRLQDEFNKEDQLIQQRLEEFTAELGKAAEEYKAKDQVQTTDNKEEGYMPKMKGMRNNKPEDEEEKNQE